MNKFSGSLRKQDEGGEWPEILSMAEDCLPLIEGASARRILQIVLRSIIKAHPSFDATTDAGRLRIAMNAMLALEPTNGRPPEDRTEMLLAMIDERVSDELDRQSWAEQKKLGRAKGRKPALRGAEPLAAIVAEKADRGASDSLIESLADEFRARESDLRDLRSTLITYGDAEARVAKLIIAILRDRDVRLDTSGVDAVRLGHWEELVY